MSLIRNVSSPLLNFKGSMNMINLVKIRVSSLLFFLLLPSCSFCCSSFMIILQILPSPFLGWSSFFSNLLDNPHSHKTEINKLQTTNHKQQTNKPQTTYILTVRAKGNINQFSFKQQTTNNKHEHQYQ